MGQKRGLISSSYVPNSDFIMKIMVWNCRGALSASFHRSINDMLNTNKPDILIVTKTKVGGSRAKDISSRLPFDGALHMDTVGYAGDLWVLWNSNCVEVDHIAATE